jgi:two-component system CheB/CheR fusion protein
VFQERQVAARDGRWFRVRIMPYRTQSNPIDRVVITVVDITAAKLLETTLRDALALLQGRCSEQGMQLDRAKSLEDVLRQAQAVLEQRIAQLAADGRPAGDFLPPSAPGTR